MSMKKSVSSRIRITKNGKVMRRTMAVGHFRTRKSGKNLLRKRMPVSSNLSAQTLKTY